MRCSLFTHVLARSAAVLFVAAVFSMPASAQRMHVGELTGENPDVSNWPHPAAPDGNPFPRSTATVAELAYRDIKAELGKALFWDEQVSSDNTVACGTCHFNSAGGTDDRLGAVASNGAFGAFGTIPQAVTALGTLDYGNLNPPSAQIARDVTGLHTPTMIGAYMFDKLFWDRRAGPAFLDEAMNIIVNFDDWAATEDLSTGPPISPVEMGHEGILWSDNSIQARLNNSFPLDLVDPTTIPADIAWLPNTGARYKKIFDKIFFSDPQFGGLQGVTRERFALAVAHYMRTLIPDQAPIDLGTMTLQEEDGFDLMFTSGCFSCHASGAPPVLNPAGILTDPFDNLFSDGRRHDIGFGLRKTTTLRNVGLRKKFFSHGQGVGGLNGNSLGQLIKFYDGQPGSRGLDGSGPNGTLTQPEFDSVLAFLGNALTDPRVAAMSFPFDQPQLASERADFNPFEGNEFGVGTAGGSGVVPEIIANGVPLAAGASLGPLPAFKVGVGNAAPNTNAIALIGTAPAAGPTIWVGGIVSLSPSITTNASGIGTDHLGSLLPASSVGIPFFVQWVVLEAGGAAFSDAAKFTPFHF